MRKDDQPDGTFLLGSRPGVKAAYGYRWRRHFHRDQLGLAIEALRRNPSDRRIWISAWDPAEDGLGALGQLNVPCPVGFTLSILDGKLYSAYMLRSSDVFVGLPYDVMGHAMLMDLIAAELRIELGRMHFTLAHPHVYDVHWTMAEDGFRHGKVKSQVELARWSLTDIEAGEAPWGFDGFVDIYRTLAAQVSWPEYHVKPEVVQ